MKKRERDRRRDTYGAGIGVVGYNRTEAGGGAD